MIQVRYATCIAQLVGVFVLPILTMAETNPGLGKDRTVKREWGGTGKGLAVSIAAEKHTYAPGEQIVLNVLLKNVGERDVRLVTPAPLALYRPTVLRPDGKESPLTPRGRILTDSALGGGSVGGVVLKPREQLCVEFVLNRLYDFSLTGKYVVSVRGVLFAQTTTIPSNKLEITVNGALNKPDGAPGKYEAEYIWGKKNVEVE